MTSGFVVIAFSFCAAMTMHGNQDVVALGYVSGDECIVRMVVGDSRGETAVINGHDIGVEIISGGAVVHIDQLQFVIQKTEGV